MPVVGAAVDMRVTWRERKYLLVVDGRGTPSSRLALALAHDCLVLKQESALQEWFYGDLRPYEHYVPLAYRLENLFEQLAWARAHPEEAQAIVRAAQAYARERFTWEGVAAYMADLLSAYAALQRFRPAPGEAAGYGAGSEVRLGREFFEEIRGETTNGCAHFANGAAAVAAAPKG